MGTAVDEVVPLRLNVIGKRVNEALEEIEPFLNHASLEGATSVTIIHGVGTGMLAKGVHEHLTRHPLIKSFGRVSRAKAARE